MGASSASGLYPGEEKKKEVDARCRASHVANGNRRTHYSAPFEQNDPRIMSVGNIATADRRLNVPRITFGCDHGAFKQQHNARGD